MKACPFTDLEELSKPHISASREAIRERLREDQTIRLEHTSPTRDIFRKTSALITALRRTGCSSKLDETTIRTEEEQDDWDDMFDHQVKIRRGYLPSVEKCEGRLLFKYTYHGRAQIR